MKHNFLNDISNFQRKVVHKLKPSCFSTSKCIFPYFSLHDEVTTDRFVVDVIEILFCVGILHPQQTINQTIEWVLGEKWEDKILCLCIAYLSLNRDQSFQKRLTKLPVLFKNVHHQGLIFRKSLLQVMQIPGLLHQ